jgi:hypothetical protein
MINDIIIWLSTLEVDTYENKYVSIIKTLPMRNAKLRLKLNEKHEQK